MKKTTRINPTMQLLRPLFAIPVILAQLARDVVASRIEYVRLEHEHAVRAAAEIASRADGIARSITAAPGTMAEARQILDAANGLTVYPRGVFPRVPVGTLADAETVGVSDESRLLEPFHGAKSEVAVAAKSPAPVPMWSAAQRTVEEYAEIDWDTPIPYEVTEWAVVDLDAPINYTLPTVEQTPMDRALALVAGGRAVKAAAREAGVSESTLRRRIKRQAA